VDDFFVVSSDHNWLERLHQELTEAYGTVTSQSDDLLGYLGMQIRSDPSTGKITLSQPGYSRRLCETLLPGFSEDPDQVRFAETPMSTLVFGAPVLRPGDEDRVDYIEYLRNVGGINHLVQYTRPDLSFAFSFVAQRSSRPTKYDWNLCLRILRYIARTLDVGLVFEPGPIALECFVDAAHNCYPDGRGHYGYCFRLGRDDGAFFGVSKKLKLTTLSSTESEYVALCEATRETVWFRRLLTDLGFPVSGPSIMWQDNQSTIQMVDGHRNFQSSKHINPKFHYTGEQVEAGEVRLAYLSSAEMIADILTKPLPTEAFKCLAAQLLNMRGVV
jgi:hypothetical protein